MLKFYGIDGIMCTTHKQKNMFFARDLNAFIVIFQYVIL
jgi:hypothetical protein